jgi:2-methylcitrate dehydratase PrpD
LPAPDTASARLAAFSSELRYEAIPPHVVAAARDHLLDAIGVGLAAAALPSTRAYGDALRAMGHADEATALGVPGRWPAPAAALHNGTLIHSLEYDDTHIASVVHGSSVLAATALAVAQKVHAPGRDLLRAYVLGWEAFVRLGLAAPGRLQPRGFQLTAVGGASIAALVASTLMGLSEEQTRNALGITASQASGTFAALADGSSSKAMNPGWAAHAGIVAALYAGAGMSGPATIYEGRFGLFGAYAGDRSLGERYSEELESLGHAWHLPDAALKAYPCCHYIHPFLECAEGMREAMGGDVAITRVLCAGPAGYETVICDPWDQKQRPRSGYEAKFSLPYCVASALLGRTIDVAFFAFDSPDPGILELASRVQWQRENDSAFPARFPARVAIVLADGRSLERSVDDVYGSPTRPMARERLLRKFRENAGFCLGREPGTAVAGLLDAIEHLDRIADVAGLLDGVSARQGQRAGLRAVCRTASTTIRRDSTR